jgi:hypothetical protein
MKNTMRKAMLSTIAMLVVAVMSLTGVTYAWFSASTTAKVEGMTMNVGTAGAGLQVAKVGGEFGAEIDFAYAGQTGNDKLQPVSTVDGLKFYTATVDVNNPGMILSSAEDTTMKNVWASEFRMRNTGTGDITVKLSAEVFSDYIDATGKASGRDAWKAARIAVVQVTDGSTLKTTGNAASGATAGVKFIYGNNADVSYKGLNGAGTNFRVDGTTAGSPVADVTPLKTTLDACTVVVPGMTDANVQQEATYKILIWFEGQDIECDNENALSSFNAAVNFEVVQ